MKSRFVLMFVLLLAAGCSTGTKSQPVADSDPLDVQNTAYSDPAPPIEYVAPSTPAQPSASPVYTPPEPAVTSTPAPTTGQTYTIQRGDTAWGLAKRFYGDGKQFHRIFDANPGLSEKNFPAGKTITIPQ